ncbi:MAG: hypothetical protein J3R72DRAFT_153060 [Linnemannia gamsii]|nr:MAG: hypothetical protein J3R72DRAFT_153060 [Linnemannia gamsii]
MAHRRHLTKAWENIIVKYKSEETSRAETKRWIRSSIAKQGHHIGHLTAGWDVLLEAAALSSSTCTHLRSLADPSIELNFAGVSTEATSIAAKLSEAATLSEVVTEIAISISTTTEMSTLEEITSLEGQSPFHIRKWIGDWHGDVWHYHVIECLYSLIIRSPGLTSPAFPHLNSMNDVSAEFRLSTLQSMKQLKELNMKQTALSMSTLLSNVPQLERLRSGL